MTLLLFVGGMFVFVHLSIFLRFVFCFHESVLYLWDLVFYLRDSFYICVIRFLFVRLSFLFVRVLLYLCDSLYICGIRFVFVRFVLYLCVAVVGHRTYSIHS